MPLLDLQRRGAEIGRIRIGALVATAGGKTRPMKLESFRFTTNNPHAAQAVADLFGGEVKPWAGGSQNYEVYTTTTSMDVMVPATDGALSQAYELWSGGGCQRRCDSVTEQIGGGPCVCPADIAERMALAAKGQACKPITRVSVILPDLPGLGVWRYQSGGYNAAHELGATAELLQRAREEGAIIPATMRLEQRETKTGTETHKFAVVVIDVRATIRELVEGTVGGTLAQALPPAPSSDVKAIEAPKTPASGPGVTPGAGGSTRGRQRSTPAASPGEPTSAQGIADEARGCTNLDRLRALYDLAHDKGWEQELVADEADLYEALDDVILARKAELDTAGAA
jgi:hypothetical protein